MPGHPVAHERFGPLPGSHGPLMVTDPNLEEQIRRLALRAMELGATDAQMDATLRCLSNHCEVLKSSLNNRTPRDTI